MINLAKESDLGDCDIFLVISSYIVIGHQLYAKYNDSTEDSKCGAVLLDFSLSINGPRYK